MTELLFDVHRGWRSRVAGIALASASLLVIAALTLFPTEDESAGLTWCLLCGDRALADALMNVVMFVPLGVGLALAGGTILLTALAGVAFTGAIEFLQALIPGRDASVSDLVFNTAGCLLGATLVRTARHWVAPAPSRRRAFLVAGVGAPLLLLGVAGVMLAPRPSRDTYTVQWMRALPHLEAYRGRVAGVWIGDVPVADGELPHLSERLRVLLSEHAPVRVDALAGPAPSGLAPILSVYDDEDREILLLGAVGDDVVFRYRTVGMAWLMDRPSLRLHGALAGVQPGEPLRLAVSRNGGGYCVRANQTASCDVGYRLSDTWGVFLALFSLGGSARELLGMAWLAALFVPAGWWLRTRDEAMAAGVAVGAGLLLIPLAVGVLASRPTAYVAAVVGLAVGWLARRAAGVPRAAHVSDAPPPVTLRPSQ